jgi:hypothetical protein
MSTRQRGHDRPRSPGRPDTQSVHIVADMFKKLRNIHLCACGISRKIDAPPVPLEKEKEKGTFYEWHVNFPKSFSGKLI